MPRRWQKMPVNGEDLKTIKVALAICAAVAVDERGKLKIIWKK
jgi:hypothetical protein